MIYRVTILNGRNSFSDQVEADNEDEAKERFLNKMSCLGAIVAVPLDVTQEDRA